MHCMYNNHQNRDFINLEKVKLKAKLLWWIELDLYTVHVFLKKGG